ncbi:MAG: T9SS type A sorting domain-containing protein [Bacteroidia bacterium]|nr:T9SS type A sorting domain-containing protein [Bacteroidia bacterium]
MSQCPNNYGQADFAVGWFKSTNHNSPPHHSDYFNSCGSNFGVPQNTWGNESAATGNAYMAITTKVPSMGFYRENIYAQLSSPLSIGSRYNVSFKLSLCDEFKFASDKMGLKFSTSSNMSVNNVAQLFAASPVTVQSGWVTLFGQFIADSAYTHIGVGNFFDDINTSEITVCNSCPQAYNLYYVDDISVILAETPSTPVSSFGSNNSICSGSGATFFDFSTNAPTSWLWSVTPNTGVTITTPSSQNPSILFSLAGTYSVSLIASNSNGPGTIFTNTVQVQSCVGIEEENELSGNYFYPNPSEGKIKIGYDLQKNSTIYVCNLLGEKLHEWNISFEAGDELDCTFLPKGVYYITLISGNTSINKKISIE